MANLCQTIWTVVFIITVFGGRISAVEDDDFKINLPEDAQFPSASFLPEKLRLSNAVYDRLLVNLGDQLSADNVYTPVKDYFARDVESDEDDDLELVQKYDMDRDDDDDVHEFVKNFPNDALLSTGFGKREIKFAKVLAIGKNGTKTFSKFRQSAKIDGNATTSAAVHFNTSYDLTTSVSGKFDVNTTYYAKGKQRREVASGTLGTSSVSESEVEERKYYQQASANSSVTLDAPSRVNIKSSVRSGSETLKLPFRSFLTLFKARGETTADKLLKIKSSVVGDVVSRVAFANKTVSLTKSCIKSYVKSKTFDINTNVNDSQGHSDDVDDDEDHDKNVAPALLYQISLIRAKAHTWTKVVSQSDSQVIVDVLTCTKTRIYTKSFKKGAFVVFSGTGQISWEKSRVTIDAKSLKHLSKHEYGIHFIKNQFEGSSLVSFVGNPFEITV